MPKHREKLKNSILQPLIYGAIAGLIIGAALALFTVCARITAEFAFGLYKNRDGALAVVCILILVVLCCFLVALIQTLCKGSNGSGIPLVEGAARGMLRVNWLSAAAGLAAGSLLAFTCGMPLGAEGPSVGLGGLIGEGVGKTAKKPTALRRCLITSGASAGFATAFNAPLTGMCFAFEETHRRFSPYILAAAFSSVIISVATSQLIFYGLSFIGYFAEIGVRAGATPLSAFRQTSFAHAIDLLKICAVALVCGGVCAAIGAGFDRAIEALAKLFSKIKLPFLRLLPAFLLAAAFGLVMFESAGGGEGTLASISVETSVWALIALLFMRLASTATASGSGATGGLFMPMLAIGGIIGVLAAKACGAMGLAAYAPNIIILCIVAFTAACVRAPITAIVMSVELTASFVNLLPCIIAVGIATVVADMTHTEPLYERMLESLVGAAPLDGSRSLRVKGVVPENSPAAGVRVRNVLWPYNCLVVNLVRGGKALVPDGETILLAGDELTVRAENVNVAIFMNEISEYMTVDAELPAPADTPDIIATAHNM